MIAIIIGFLLIAGSIFFRNIKNIFVPPTIVVTPQVTIQPTETPSTPTPSPTTSVTPTAPTTTQTPQITIKNFSFNPNSTTVKTGTTVEWVNTDSVSHTITSDSGIFDSQPIQPGETFSFTFNNTGTFPYHCSIHTSMRGSVVVTQ